MNGSLAECLVEVNNTCRGVKIMMMLLAANLVALNTVFAQVNMENDKSAPSPYTIAYSSNGIVLTDNEGKSKNRIVSSGGYAAWSPDGKRIAFYAKYDERKTWSIHTMNSDGTDWRRLTHEKDKWDNSPTWSPDGTKIAFSREYTDSEKVWHEEVWIMNSDGSQQAQIKPIKGGGPYFTPDGRIVYHSAFKNKKSEISIADIDGGNIIHLIDNEAEDQHPEVSPNGKQIAFMSDRDGNKEIYVMNLDGSDQKRLTFSEAAEWYPSWSPDGSKLIFLSNLDGERNIYMMNQDGSSVKKIISNGTQPAWSKIENKIDVDLPLDSYRDKVSPYFGQKPPGLIPEVFAPGIISINGRSEHGISFSPDLDEVYFSAHKKDEETSIYFSKLKGDKWTPVERANFTNGEKNEELYPSVSLTDKRIYFTALDSIFSDEKIWYVNRLDDSWSDAIQLDSPLNDDLVFYVNQAKNGDLFYTNISKRKMNYAPNKNGEFPEVLEVELEFGHHGFISPSQDYLLVHDQNKENEKRKDSDVYVCFKQKDGTWAKPINLGDVVNSTGDEGGPSITPDGKYMFFGRDEEDGTANVYWVSTEIIERLRPDD
ncbi:MAG: hypothetical protein RJQ09_20645 [Cyclobacteriaceae bacterium]